MTLNKNQYVLFENGTQEGWLEARYSEKHQAFYTFTDEGEKIFSTDVREKESKKRKAFVPTSKNCTKLITPYAETEKVYIVYDGSNGLVGRGQKSYSKHIAKAICYIAEDGKIFAPTWA